MKTKTEILGSIATKEQYDFLCSKMNETIAAYTNAGQNITSIDFQTIPHPPDFIITVSSFDKVKRIVLMEKKIKFRTAAKLTGDHSEFIFAYSL